MAEAQITCPKCLRTQPPPAIAWEGAGESQCPRCNTTLVMAAFPRLAAIPAPQAPNQRGQFAQEGQAVCKFYPELQAETLCDECGCLMSRKAAVEWAGRTICMPCLHQLREKKSAEAYSPKRTLYDNVALGLVLFLLPLTLATGPVALFYLLRYRKAPRSLVPRSSFRWWLALILSIAVTAGWIFVFVAWVAMIVRAATS